MEKQSVENQDTEEVTEKSMTAKTDVSLPTASHLALAKGS